MMLTQTGNKQFTIGDLERLSNIKAHTIRIWEVRYKIFSPLRTTANRRRYNLQDLQKLLFIAQLCLNGFKISRLAEKSVEELSTCIEHFSDGSNKRLSILNKLIFQMYSLQSNAFEQCIEGALSQWPFPVCYEEIITPFLINTGLSWQGSRQTEEHVVVTTIRKILQYETHKLDKLTSTKPSVILFLLDTKQLDLALLYTQYHLKSQGISVILMGNDVSLENIYSICSNQPSSILYTYHNNSQNPLIKELLLLMQSALKNHQLIFTIHTDLDTIHSHLPNTHQMPFQQALCKLCQ